MFMFYIVVILYVRAGNVETEHVCCGAGHVAVFTGMAELTAETCRARIHRTRQRRKVSLRTRLHLRFSARFLSSSDFCLATNFPIGFGTHFVPKQSQEVRKSEI